MDCRVRSTAADLHGKRGSQSAVYRGDSWALIDFLGFARRLTKLNYNNACIFADGEPVTLEFADRVGEILTAGPIGTDTPPLPFKFYI
jgi:hypothetical protein